MNWLERLARLERKNQRRVVARNVRAYRRRQRQAGMRRIDLALPLEQHAALVQLRRPGETISQTVGRLLECVTGNT
jgi:hypothetical protein